MDNPVDIELQRRYTEDTKPPNPTAMDKWMIDFSRALPVVIIVLVVLSCIVAGVVAVFKCWAMRIDREVYSDESMLELQAYASFTSSNRRRPKSSTSPR
uniref:Uncharacterized protein n=1 Tax=Pristionchus pacificus TaxID=54126 RepID=A0A8R1UXR9_PRIPA